MNRSPCRCFSLRAGIGITSHSAHPRAPIVCNEEGKLEGLPLNRALRDEDGDSYRFLKLEMLQRQFLKGAVS